MGERGAVASDNLKEANSRALAAYVVAHAFAVAWVALGFPFTFSSFSTAVQGELPEAGLAVVATVVLITLFNAVGGPNLKAILVFWRIHDTLPGSRAFSKLAPNDPRVDLESLRKLLGGTLPTSPTEQNTRWFQLYDARREQAAVASTHKDYLLLRDICWLTTVAAIAGTSALFVLHHRQATAIYFAACIGLYLLARFGAKFRGERFVLTVLAAASASTESPKAVIHPQESRMPARP